jgi:4a-hydroxytetrahydrobiopterin dehydratase
MNTEQVYPDEPVPHVSLPMLRRPPDPLCPPTQLRTHATHVRDALPCRHSSGRLATNGSRDRDKVEQALNQGDPMMTIPLTTPELEHISERLPGWSRVAVDGIVRIERTYSVPDYATAMSFTQLLGEMADDANHHPTVLIQRAHVTVAWWTITAKTLTQIDLTMAERTNRLFEAVLAGSNGSNTGHQ